MPLFSQKLLNSRPTVTYASGNDDLCPSKFSLSMNLDVQGSTGRCSNFLPTESSKCFVQKTHKRWIESI